MPACQEGRSNIVSSLQPAVRRVAIDCGRTAIAKPFVSVRKKPRRKPGTHPPPKREVQQRPNMSFVNTAALLATYPRKCLRFACQCAEKLHLRCGIGNLRASYNDYATNPCLQYCMGIAHDESNRHPGVWAYCYGVAAFE